MIGFYDGALGPGTGSFFVFTLVGLLGYSFLEASAKARLANWATNLAALCVFVPQGAVLWKVGLLMGVCNLAGGYLGARTAVARGAGSCGCSSSWSSPRSSSGSAGKCSASGDCPRYTCCTGRETADVAGARPARRTARGWSRPGSPRSSTSRRRSTGVGFWAGVTGYDVSPTAATHDEFATLVPPEGDAFLRVQRVDDGPGRMHLDLHSRAGQPPKCGRLGPAGSRTTATCVLSSPGGFTFCFVPPPGGDRRPRPGRGHWSLVDQVCLDIPRAPLRARVGSGATSPGWSCRSTSRGVPGPGPARGQPIRLLLQRLGRRPARVTAHLDSATDDREAETARHEALGAKRARAAPALHRAHRSGGSGVLHHRPRCGNRDARLTNGWLACRGMTTERVRVPLAADERTTLLAMLTGTGTPCG